jgi:ribonuclease G
VPEWWIERGVGETRFALVDADEIVEARILLDGVVPAGTGLRAALKVAGRPAVAAVGSDEYLLPYGAPGVSEGASLNIEVTREAITGPEPWKRPLARVIEGDPVPASLPNGEELILPSSGDRLADAGWNDLIEEARGGAIEFAGGALRVSPTPAMTLIDVDGTLPAADLALAGASAAVRTILRHGIGGSIGIDLPTVDGKAARKRADDAIDALLPKPFERTAMNGFGFVQIVRPRRHASLFELAQDRAAFEARALLRRAAFEAAGPKTLVAHPIVAAVIQEKPDWLAALSRQLGGTVGLRAAAGLTMSGGYAEAV